MAPRGNKNAKGNRGGKGAPMGSKRAKGNKGGNGQEPKYRPEYCLIAKMLCEKGATNAELTIAFGISRSTFFLWRATESKFAESILRGKESYDTRVVDSVAERAIGYDYIADKIMQYNGAVIRAKHSVHVPADVGAAKFWLACRQPAEWSESNRLNLSVEEGTPLSRLFDAICGNKIMPAGHYDQLPAPNVIEHEDEAVEVEVGRLRRGDAT